MEIDYEVIDTWKGNKIVYTGTKEQCENYLRGNNVYQMNYSKLQMKMKPTYINKYIGEDLFDALLSKTPWVNKEAPRDECFMALESLEYTYGKGFERTYNSLEMSEDVLNIMSKLNEDFGTEYNVCFLNFYKSEKEHLGWHADDSPEMDTNHPIAVVSFGAERYIWCKEKDYKGEIPDEDRYLLGSGSLFIMPKGFQEVNLHRIPKNDRPCGGRISLTFRKFKNT